MTASLALFCNLLVRAGARQGDENFSADQPASILLRPLRRVAPADDGCGLRAAGMARPAPLFEGERPVRADFDRNRLTLIDERRIAARRERGQRLRHTAHRLAERAAHGDVLGPEAGDGIEIAASDGRGLRRARRADQGGIGIMLFVHIVSDARMFFQKQGFPGNGALIYASIRYCRAFLWRLECLCE